MAGNSTTGVAVGKFNPPHLGHRFMLTTAANRVRNLYVLLGDRPDQTIPAEDRARWLRESLPGNVSIIITPDDIPEANEPWAQRALELLPMPPDIAFTSEPWGPGWAAAMGAVHVSVDLERAENPVSATELRADLKRHFPWLVPAARTDLARRVALVGAESTGKTTLARDLASAIGTVWVPEYGRWYWEGRRYRSDQSWSSAEFAHIADTHHALADRLAQESPDGTVLLDTDALVTRVWHQRYLGRDSADVARIAAANRPDLYIVCAPDFEWVQDGTRESRDRRRAMHDRTLELVGESGIPWALLAGPSEERIGAALELIAKHTAFAPMT